MTFPGGGVFDLAPGQFTDDGEMTMALVNALAENNGVYDQDAVARSYSDWADSKPFDMGNATSSALKHVDRSSQKVSEILLIEGICVISQSDYHQPDCQRLIFRFLC